MASSDRVKVVYKGDAQAVLAGEYIMPGEARWTSRAQLEEAERFHPEGFEVIDEKADDEAGEQKRTLPPGANEYTPGYGNAGLNEPVVIGRMGPDTKTASGMAPAAPTVGLNTTGITGAPSLNATPSVPEDEAPQNRFTDDRAAERAATAAEVEKTAAETAAETEREESLINAGKSQRADDEAAKRGSRTGRRS